jgi:hypothetical protein
MVSRPTTAAVAAAALALGLSACGETSKNNFKGESHEVAQAISNFQSDASARDQKKLCENDLASSIKQRLQSSGGCQAVFKKQLVEVDSPNLTVESVAVKGTSASARVKSMFSGKNRITTVSLVKEGVHWKIASTG